RPGHRVHLRLRARLLGDGRRRPPRRDPRAAARPRPPGRPHGGRRGDREGPRLAAEPTRSPSVQVTLCHLAGPAVPSLFPARARTYASAVAREYQTVLELVGRT